MSNVLTRRLKGGQALQFGAMLRALRDDRRLSQGALAERLHRSTSFISLLESGQRHPTRELISELSEALRLTQDELQQLLAAAGFLADSLESAIARVVQVITEQTATDDVDRSFIIGDLTATARGWREALRGTQALCDGDFATASTVFEELASHREFSPTLKIYLTYRLSDPLLPRGKFTLAQRLLKRARRTAEKLTTDWSRVLWAEVVTRQGIVAMREGLHSVAKGLLDETQSLYARLLYGTPANEAMAALCFGRIYRLRAQLALLQGEAAEALGHCMSAEALLSRAPLSATHANAMRRAQSLKAWAHSKLGEPAMAIELHTQARQACERAGDEYGAITNWLYLGDDYRYALEAIVNDDAPTYDASLSAPEARRAHLQQALAPAQVRLAEASQAYEQARGGLEHKGDKMLLGRCLRSLAIIQRFRACLAATPAEEQHERASARRNLELALELEREIGQGRRIPGIYATFADLMWDQGNVVEALGYFQSALDALNSPLVNSIDPAAQNLRTWTMNRMQVLRDYESAVHPTAEPRWSGAVDLGAPLEWRRLCERLIEMVYDFVYIQAGGLHAYSEEDEAWQQKMLQVEEVAGPRILAQNTLSNSLSSRLPAGSPGATGPCHVERHKAFLRWVQTATDPDGKERNRDLCYRESVRQGLATPVTEVLVEAQLKQATELMRDCSSGYLLDAALFPLPLAFEVKGAHVLLEIHGELARYLAPQQASKQRDPLCYYAENIRLAQQLREIFAQLVALARERITGNGASTDWLQDLLYVRPHVPGVAQRL